MHEVESTEVTPQLTGGNYVDVSLCVVVMCDKGYEVQRSARDEYNQVKLSRTISIVLVVNRE